MTKYVATEELSIGLHRAHNVGDEVPEENIERNGWSGKVAPVDSEEGQEAVESTTPYDPAEHSVDDVVRHLREVDPEERERILQEEGSETGKQRTGILGG